MESRGAQIFQKTTEGRGQLEKKASDPRWTRQVNNLLMRKFRFLNKAIGNNLGDKKHADCILISAGEIVEERTIANARKGLERSWRKILRLSSRRRCLPWPVPKQEQSGPPPVREKPTPTM